MPTARKIMTGKDDGNHTVNEVRNHADDPFVIKKIAKAKEMVSKIKFPEHMMK
jgi:hypothetical protein